MKFEDRISSKYNIKSRFELLQQHYPEKFQYYMYELKHANILGMAIPLIDAGIKLTNLAKIDSRWDELVKKRTKEIEIWHSKQNILKNINKILNQIEENTGTKFDTKTREKIIEKYYKG